MNHDREELDAFQHLLAAAAQAQSVEPQVLLIDRLVGPQAGQLLRSCAVPHEFDLALLRMLAGSSASEAEERYVQFSELSLIQVNDASLGVHERWRAPIWRWWLEDARRDDFVALNQTLADWFATPGSRTGEDSAARRRMFHLIGCRREEGLQVFEALFRTARHNRRFSECSLLLRLVHEYDPLLQPREHALLHYQEGKLASDLSEWERALPLLSSVADAEHAEAKLRFNAQVRLAHALRQLGRTDEALTLLEQARSQLTATSPARPSAWRAFYEQGEILRDLGELDAASTALDEALRRAADSDGDADLAGIHNGLGTVRLRLLEIDAAIESFQTSLQHLAAQRDAIRRGGVLNNLGLAQLERMDCQGAEETFNASLETKRAAGDLRGQATTLLNLSRVQAALNRLEDAGDSAEQAADLCTRAGDARGRVRALLARAKLLRQSGRATDATALLGLVVEQAHAAADEQTVAGALSELERLKQHRGMSWWAWMLIASGVLLLIAMFAALGEHC